MKYNKRWEWGNYVEYRNICKGDSRYRIGSIHVPVRFRSMLGTRVINIKRRVVDDWKRCYREIDPEGGCGWHRSDI